MLGELVLHENFPGEGIRPRTVAVWLPPGYHDSDADHPVLYMHDGHNCFDPATSYASADWELDEVIVGLGDRITPPIVVAPFTDDYRMEEYWVGPTGDAYLAWLAGDLRTFVNETYQTRATRENTAVMGSSMGGLSAFRAIFLRPEVYSMAGCLSPAFLYAMPLIAEVAQSDWPASPTKLYIDNGDDELDTQLQPAIDDMIDALAATPFEQHGELVFERFADAPHHESSWSRRVWRPLELFFGRA